MEMLIEDCHPQETKGKKPTLSKLFIDYVNQRQLLRPLNTLKQTTRRRKSGRRRKNIRRRRRGIRRKRRKRRTTQYTLLTICFPRLAGLGEAPVKVGQQRLGMSVLCRVLG